MSKSSDKNPPRASGEGLHRRAFLEVSASAASAVTTGNTQLLQIALTAAEKEIMQDTAGPLIGALKQFSDASALINRAAGGHLVNVFNPPVKPETALNALPPASENFTQVTKAHPAALVIIETVLAAKRSVRREPLALYANFVVRHPQEFGTKNWGIAKAIKIDEKQGLPKDDERISQETSSLTEMLGNVQRQRLLQKDFEQLREERIRIGEKLQAAGVQCLKELGLNDEQADMLDYHIVSSSALPFRLFSDPEQLVKTADEVIQAWRAKKDPLTGARNFTEPAERIESDDSAPFSRKTEEQKEPEAAYQDTPEYTQKEFMHVIAERPNYVQMLRQGRTLEELASDFGARITDLPSRG